MRRLREPSKELRAQHRAAGRRMDTASVDHAHASSTLLDGALQPLVDRTPGLLPTEPMQVDLFVHGDLAAAQSPQVGAVDSGGDPLESLRLVAQDFERPLSHGRKGLPIPSRPRIPSPLGATYTSG
jgi:hypothetical protein